MCKGEGINGGGNLHLVSQPGKQRVQSGSSRCHCVVLHRLQPNGILTVVSCSQLLFRFQIWMRCRWPLLRPCAKLHLQPSWNPGGLPGPTPGVLQVGRKGCRHRCCQLLFCSLCPWTASAATCARGTTGAVAIVRDGPPRLLEDDCVAPSFATAYMKTAAVCSHVSRLQHYPQRWSGNRFEGGLMFVLGCPPLHLISQPGGRGAESGRAATHRCNQLAMSSHQVASYATSSAALHHFWRTATR